MIFTTKAEYGVRLLVELGRQASGQPVSLKAISEAEGLPLAVSRAHRGPAQEGRPRREHARRARRLSPVASCGVDHDGRGRAGARGRRRAHELLRRRLPGGSRAVLARRRPRSRLRHRSCCGRACRAASSRRWPKRRSPSSSPSRSARRCLRPPRRPSPSDSHNDTESTWLISRSATSTSGPPTRTSSRGSTSRPARARSTPSWVPTAPASRRWPTSSWVSPTWR